MTRAERHARRLLRSYPRVWRERYGGELAALLVDDLADRPRSLQRDLDVVRAGLGARLAACGLARGPVRNRPAVTAVATAALVGFVASALSIWTQLADGWLATPPETATVTVSLVALSTWLAGLLVLAAALGIQLARAVLRACRSGRGALVLWPLLSGVTSATVFIAGIWLTAPRWPGVRLGHHDGVLAPAARIGWAATDTISTFWLHPTRLLTLPVGELAWMVLCPIAVVGFGWSVVRLVRVTTPPSARVLPHVSTVAGLAALPCFIAAAAWVVASQHAANANYRAGTLDLVLIAGMAAAAGVVHQASAGVR
jgi:hypothetical protein